MKTTEIKDTMKLRNEVMYNRGYNVALCQLLCHLARISHTHTKHRSPGDVKFMYAINLTRFPTEDRCPHTVSPFPWHFKGARGAG